MPKMMAAAMPIVILTWVLVAALGIPNNPRLVAFRIRGRKHILYWCAIPTVLAFVVLAHFNGESQAVLRGVFRWSTAGCFTTGWRILSLTVIASLIAHIVFLFRGFAEANPKELERR
jgi:ABC-type glycerol-3-phosphate transport system permease component